MHNKHYPQIDSRREKDIQEEINALAKSYVPEWKFDTENPDFGSALAMVYAKQTADNVQLFNHVFRKYQIEFVNMFGLSRNCVKPAQSVVVVDLDSDHIKGIPIPKHTKLLSDPVEEDTITFETQNEMYVTSNRISDFICVHEKTGQVFEQESPPFFVFDENTEKSYMNELYLYHEFFLDEDVFAIKFIGVDAIDKNIKFTYLSEEGYVPFEEVKYKDCYVILKTGQKPVKTTYQEKEMQVIRFEKTDVVRFDEHVSSIECIMKGKESPLEFFSDGMVDKDVEDVEPFGQDLMEYKNCYLGHDQYFSKKGAEITIRFELSFEEKKYVLALEEENLKIVKRKNRYANYYSTADVWIQEISIEYFNGRGWKAVPELRGFKQLFAQENNGIYELRFLAPSDWEADGIVGEYKRCLRIQAVKVENSFQKPSMHHYPLLKNIRVEYNYHQRNLKPEAVKRVSGKEETLLTFTDEKKTCIFQAFPYENNAMYIGFSKPLKEGPISMFWNLEENGEERKEEVDVVYEYSTIMGFRSLKILDETQELQYAGITRFYPPVDMKQYEVFGKMRYWIRVIDKKNSFSEKQYQLPYLKELFLNAVEVRNVDTLEMLDYYIDEIKPNMTYSFTGGDILKADVWVNEVEQLTKVEMQVMLEESPKSVIVEYDFNNEIENFYVKWKEVDNFFLCQKYERVYMLDRLNKRLIFGDGIHVRIPQNLTSVGFKVQLQSSAGILGNVRKHKINTFKNNMMFLDGVYNPLPAYGGSEFEKQDKALERGIGILNSRNHLVTERDFCREILNYSDGIEQVACVNGEMSDQQEIFLVVLMKDYLNQNYSFRRMKEQLYPLIMSRCTMAIQEGNLKIMEPIFVTLAVEVWLQVEDEHRLFSKQTKIIERLESYINPLRTEKGEGWQIGVLPTESQIQVMIRSVLHQEKIKYMSITAEYTDTDGAHTLDLKDLSKTPFMIGKNGTHRVYTYNEN